MVAITVDAKGRVSIPAEVRGELGIEPGDVLFLESDTDHAVMHIAKAINPFDGLAKLAIRDYRRGKSRTLREIARETGIDVDVE